MREIQEAIEMFEKEAGYNYGEDSNRKVKTALAALKTMEWIEGLSKITDIRPWAIVTKFNNFMKE